MVSTNTTTAFTFLTGTIVAANSSAKPPTAANGITAVFNGQLQTLVSSTPGALWRASADVPVTPMGICGDLANGVAIFNTSSSTSKGEDGSSSTQTSSVAYCLTGVGVPGASWSQLPALPTDDCGDIPAIDGMSGDLANGLVAFSGKYVYAIMFSSYPREWIKIGQTPNDITAIAGDPTNGFLVAVNSGNGASVLYAGSGSCVCSLAPVTGGSLPVARVLVSQMCGSVKNGYVLYGENQLILLMVTPATSTTGPTGTQTVLSPLPFSIVAMTGDNVNGMAVIAIPNSSTAKSGKLLASCPAGSSTVALASSWTVVALQAA